MPRLGRTSEHGHCADADPRRMREAAPPVAPADFPVAAPEAASPHGARKTLAQMTQRLRGLLRRKGQSSEDAEDLVQDAMLKFELYQRGQAVRDPEAFLRRTVVNQAIDERRRTRRSPLLAAPLDSFDLIDPSPCPDTALDARRGLARLHAGLAAMNAKTREIVLAQRLDGLTYAQIAERHGISESAVEKRLARGMLFLQEWMEGW